MVCRIGVTAERVKKIKRVIFFNICACGRICGKMGSDFIRYNIKHIGSVVCVAAARIAVFSFMSSLFSTMLLFVMTYGD